MTPGASATIGIDLGGTNVRAAVVDGAGRVLAEERAPTPLEWPALHDTIVELVGRFRIASPDLAAVGVGAAGLVDRDGAVHYAPNIPRLIRVPLQDILTASLTRPVVVDNDANVAALGELRHGAARGVSHGLVVTLGTGVGGGIISDGRIVRGAHGFAAEVGHWQFDPLGPRCACGEPGHWEAEASGTALGQLAQAWVKAGDAPGVLARAGGDPATVTGVHVGDSAAAGEPDGRDLLPRVRPPGRARLRRPGQHRRPRGHRRVGRAGRARRRAPRSAPRRVRLPPRRGGLPAADPDRRRRARRPGRRRRRRRTGPGGGALKLGITVPSFVTDPGLAVAVACAAEAGGLDGVFVYDHLFRAPANGARRPALEPVALLGALSSATSRVTLGTLVARASLRPAASLHAAYATLARLAPGRLVAGIGAGDSESRAEHETFGVPIGTVQDRVAWLRAAVLATRGESYPVWVGGPSAAVRTVAADLADGWNQWGGPVEQFAARAREVRAWAGRPMTCSWGGLVVLDATEHAAAAKAERLHAGPSTIVGDPGRVADALASYGAAGADWVIVGPVDARDPATATRLGEQVRPRVVP